MCLTLTTWNICISFVIIFQLCLRLTVSPPVQLCLRLTVSPTRLTITSFAERMIFLSERFCAAINSTLSDLQTWASQQGLAGLMQIGLSYQLPVQWRLLGKWMTDHVSGWRGGGRAGGAGITTEGVVLSGGSHSIDYILITVRAQILHQL